MPDTLAHVTQQPVSSTDQSTPRLCVHRTTRDQFAPLAARRALRPMLSVAATFFFAALDELSADSSFFLVASICFKSAASLLLALAALAARMVFSLMAAVFSNLAVAAYWVASFTLSWATFFCSAVSLTSAAFSVT